MIELAALRISRGAGDAGSLKRGSIRDGDMAVDPFEDCGVTVRDSIQLLAGREDFLRPERVIPSAALQPLAGRRCLRGALDAVDHLVERFASREVDGKLDTAGVAQMGVRIVDAGHGKGAAEIDELRLRPFRLQQRRICTCRGDDSIAYRDGADEVESALAEPHAGQDVAVVVDGIRRGGRRGER